MSTNREYSQCLGEIQSWLSSQNGGGVPMIGDACSIGLGPEEMFCYGEGGNRLKQVFKAWMKTHTSVLTDCGRDGHPSPCLCEFMAFRMNMEKNCHFFINCDDCGIEDFEGNRWVDSAKGYKYDLCENCFLNLSPEEMATFECVKIEDRWSLDKIMRTHYPDHYNSENN